MPFSLLGVWDLLWKMFHPTSKCRSRQQTTRAGLLLLFLIGAGCLLSPVSSTVLPRSNTFDSFAANRPNRPSDQPSAWRGFSRINLTGYIVHQKENLKHFWMSNPQVQPMRLLGQELSQMRRILDQTEEVLLAQSTIPIPAITLEDLGVVVVQQESPESQTEITFDVSELGLGTGNVTLPSPTNPALTLHLENLDVTVQQGSPESQIVLALNLSRLGLGTGNATLHNHTNPYLTLTMENLDATVQQESPESPTVVAFNLSGLGLGTGNITLPTPTNPALTLALEGLGVTVQQGSPGSRTLLPVNLSSVPFNLSDLGLGMGMVTLPSPTNPALTITLKDLGAAIIQQEGPESPTLLALNLSSLGLGTGNVALPTPTNPAFTFTLEDLGFGTVQQESTEYPTVLALNLSRLGLGKGSLTLPSPTNPALTLTLKGMGVTIDQRESPESPTVLAVNLSSLRLSAGNIPLTQPTNPPTNPASASTLQDLGGLDQQNRPEPNPALNFDFSILGFGKGNVVLPNPTNPALTITLDDLGVLDHQDRPETDPVEELDLSILGPGTGSVTLPNPQSTPTQITLLPERHPDQDHGIAPQVDIDQVLGLSKK
eukprot:gene21972-29031_t